MCTTRHRWDRKCLEALSLNPHPLKREKNKEENFDPVDRKIVDRYSSEQLEVQGQKWLDRGWITSKDYEVILDLIKLKESDDADNLLRQDAGNLYKAFAKIRKKLIQQSSAGDKVFSL